LGHPKLKNFLALSMVTEGVPKKCGKQEKGKIRRNDFSWQKTSELLWNCIEKAAKE